MADKGKSGAEELKGATMKLTAVNGAATSWNGTDWDNAKKAGPTVKMVAGEKAITWTSSDTQLKISLPDGTYTLSETAAPSDYKEITTITFTVTNGKVTGTSSETVSLDGNNNVVTAFDEAVATPTPADVYISKKDMADKTATSANELTGAAMQLTAVSGDATSWDASAWASAVKAGPDVTKVSGSSAVTWTSGSTQLKISLPDGKYTLKENAAPAGYKVITETTFELKDGKVVSSTSATVTADGNTNTVTAFDELWISDIVFSKKDFADKGSASGADELVGAKMKLTAKSGPAASWDADAWTASKKAGPAVTKVSGSSAVEWTSSSTQLKLALPDGTYELSETAAPDKYTAITTISFTIKDGKVTGTSSETVTLDGTNNVVTAFDKAVATPTPAEISISKKDMVDKGVANADELPGATMQLTAKSGDATTWDADDWTSAKKDGPNVTKVDGSSAVTWTSGTSPLKINLPDGKYELKENLAPTGYNVITTTEFEIKDGKVVTLTTDTVTADGDTNTVTAFDELKTSDIVFSKKDFADKGNSSANELVGATMKLTAKSGPAASWDADAWTASKKAGPAVSKVSGENAVTWTSSATQLKLALPDGTYELSETAAPNKYTAITTISFTIKDGKVTGTSSETVTLDGTNNVVTAFDKAAATPTPAEISISKKDMVDKGVANADELPGATMQLTAKSGDATTWTDSDWTSAKKDGPDVTKVDGSSAVTWTSGTSPLKINLPDGKYELKENLAPTGYNVITTTEFEIKDGKVVTLTTDTVTADGDTNTVTAFDELRITDIVFSKKDMADKGKDNAEELAGATMKLTAVSGAATSWSGTDWDNAKKAGPTVKMVAGEKAVTWTSGSTQLKLALPDGTYTLSETAVPSGYKEITTITFKIENGKVTGTSSETVTLDGTNNVVTAFDEATAPALSEVVISKKDMVDKGVANADELPGATMTLTAVSGDATGWDASDWTTAKKEGPDVSKVDGSSAVTWTTGNTSLKINLPDGKYTLEENGAPAGYKVITTTTFEIKDGKVVSSTSATVTADGNTNTVTAFDELWTSDVVFSKKDFANKDDANADELEGATMKLTAKSGAATEWGSSDWDGANKAGPAVTMVSGEKAVTWTSTTTQLKLNLPDGTYELSETVAPDKYDIITTITFTIENGVVKGTSSETVTLDGTNNVVTAFDKAITPPAPDTSKVTFSKQDMTKKGSELPDAHMKLSTTETTVDFSTLTHTGGSDVKVSDNKKEITWTTTDTQFAVWLPDGKYTLTEELAPNGYKVITTTTFTVKGGKVDSTESTTDVSIDGVNNIITAFDEAKYFDIQLSKEDIAHNLIAGAVLSITSVDGHDLTNVKVTQGSTTVTPTFSNGNHTFSFSSSGDAYTKIEGLRVGKYVLEETTTPEKYLTAEAIEFEITNDGELKYNGQTFVIGSRIVMVDRADPDYFTKVTINGQDKEDKKDLPDVVIQISSSTPTVDLTGVNPNGGDVIDKAEKTITIRTTGGPVELGLPDGEYIIKQISGPKEYDTVPSAPFKVEGGKVVPTGTPVNINIDDHSIVVLLPKSQPSKKSSKGSVPATGVGVSYTNVAGAALVTAAVAAMGICIVVFKKKKKEY